jgi:hypothetical protein
MPRLGTEPRLGEKVRVSAVRFSSRMLSVLETGIGNGVGVAVLSGRKMVLKPLPVKAPVKAASGPRLGGGVGAVGVSFGARADTAPNLKPLGSEMAAVLIVLAIAQPSIAHELRDSMIR